MNLSLMMLHIDQSFKCEYSSSNLLSAFNVAIYVAVSTTPFEWEIQIFPAYAVRMPF